MGTSAKKNNMELWDKLKKPPKEALSTIKGGRLAGMTDIKPQWRLQAITEVLGPVGFGWTYEIKRLWQEQTGNVEVAAFAEIRFKYKDGGEWSEWFSGIGGSMLVANEKRGLHTSDEAYKMAVTDALSVAMKQMGVASDIYMGLSDSKYSKTTDTPNQEPKGDSRGSEAVSGGNEEDGDVEEIVEIQEVEERLTKTGKIYHVISYVEAATGIDGRCSTWNKNEAEACKAIIGKKTALSYVRKGQYKNFVGIRDVDA